MLSWVLESQRPFAVTEHTACLQSRWEERENLTKLETQLQQEWMGKTDLTFTVFPCKDSPFYCCMYFLTVSSISNGLLLLTWPRPSTLCLFVPFTPLCSRREITSLNSFNKIKLCSVFFVVVVIYTLEYLGYHDKGGKWLKISTFMWNLLK